MNDESQLEWEQMQSVVDQGRAIEEKIKRLTNEVLVAKNIRYIELTGDMSKKEQIILNEQSGDMYNRIVQRISDIFIECAEEEIKLLKKEWIQIANAYCASQNAHTSIESRTPHPTSPE